jgi:protein CpxP
MKIKYALSFRNIYGQQPFICQEVNVSINVHPNVFTKTRKDKNMSTAINRMTIGLVLVIGIAVLFSAQAQKQPQRMTIEDRVKILKDSLKLSDEQSAKITKILEDQREEMTMARKDNHDNPDSMRTVMQEIMKKTDSQIKAVLTEDQAKKYDEMLKGRRTRVRQRTQESGK